MRSFEMMIKITDKEQALKVYSETYDTKFAELIVLECAHLVDTLNEAYEAPSTGGKFIKEHFGVKE